jgi:hypothetical protein
MAEDPETPEEEAHPAPTEPAKGPGKRRTVDRPVSLYPLSFEEAVDGLLQVKPEPETRTTKKPRAGG